MQLHNNPDHYASTITVSGADLNGNMEVWGIGPTMKLMCPPSSPASCLAVFRIQVDTTQALYDGYQILRPRVGTCGSVAFRWRFSKNQIHQKAQENQGYQSKTSGISGIFLAPPTNLYHIVNNYN